jgi:SAM-dependent methyltransferase
LGLEAKVKSLAEPLARDLLQAAHTGGTEADFRRRTASLISAAAEEARVSIEQQDEVFIARGRADSVYNRFIIEYKKPGLLKDKRNAPANIGAVEQVKEYIAGLAKRQRREVTRFAGVVTDGFWFIFVRPVGSIWLADEPIKVSTESCDRFLRLLFALAEGAALIPENLIANFGPGALTAHRAVRALHSSLVRAENPPIVDALFRQWKEFFGEVTEYGEWSGKIEAKKEFKTFIRGMKLDPSTVDAPRVFFVLHTYYAILVKFIALRAAARFAPRGGETLARWAVLPAEDLRRNLRDLERRGGVFRDLGIKNFLEGSFFFWYVEAWGDEIEGVVRDLLKRLAEYDPSALDLAPEFARDLLKKLYHGLLPREIRHDLGEYYTPDWLAERLLIMLDRDPKTGRYAADPDKRILDPACGSGTFLVIVIRAIRERARREGRNPTETLEKILTNVRGIDLNPLAVTAARTNYLLALGDLIQHRRGEIEIPVYLSDSVALPIFFQKERTGLFSKEIIPIPTSVGEFQIPTVLARVPEPLFTLTELIEECVEAGTSIEGFLERLRRAVKLPIEDWEQARPLVQELYERIVELHRGGLNGVWARILRDAFRPVFFSAFDFVVGNPPWVNWESLPDGYRDRTKPIWERYGLFPHGGMDTILGKGKKDISMLMTYVVADRFLKDAGRLGFVLTQSVFKTSGAGQGFRRFELPPPERKGIAPELVEDFTEINPFEGASNRTVVAVFRKGKRWEGRCPYSWWRKKTKGERFGYDTPYEVVTSDLLTFKNWMAEPIDTSDNTSAWVTARAPALKAIRKIAGQSQYRAYAGSFTGGANAVYWLDEVSKRPDGLIVVSNLTAGAKRKVEQVNTTIEADILYPLLRGRDVDRWNAKPSALLLMAQNPKTRTGIPLERMEVEFPKAYAYLKRFEKMLEARAAYKRYFDDKDAFWTMFNIGEYTFTPWKVVWREQADSLTVAVVGQKANRVVVPDHKLMLVPLENEEEAHYLAAVLNSSPARMLVKAYSVETSMDTHILENVRVPRFDPKSQLHGHLALLSAKAHRAAAKEDRPTVGQIEIEIDDAVREIWALSATELAEVKYSLADLA